jgi:hypothetical protein
LNCDWARAGMANSAAASAATAAWVADFMNVFPFKWSLGRDRVMAR